MTFIFDIDGTICFDGKTISKEILDSISKLIYNGDKVIFATARPLRDSTFLIDHFFDKIDIIGGNGTIIRKNNKVYANYIPKNIAIDLLKKYSNNNNSVLIDYDWNYYYKGDINSELFKK